LPGVTVLIPTKPDQAEIQAVTAARAFDYPPDKLEILVARGRQPSVQRNTGLKAARGELIYFLDDDSVAPPGNLRRAVEHFRDPKVKIVGGPNLCPPDAPELEQVFALVLASWLAFGPSRARYASVGAVRESGEKELILCNLIARRDTMLELGGFNEALYPNEENALMDELQKRGDKLIYDAPTARGGSGGPVLNTRGQVVGINSAYIDGFSGGTLGILRVGSDELGDGTRSESQCVLQTTAQRSDVGSHPVRILVNGSRLRE